MVIYTSFNQMAQGTGALVSGVQNAMSVFNGTWHSVEDLPEYPTIDLQIEDYTDPVDKKKAGLLTLPMNNTPFYGIIPKGALYVGDERGDSKGELVPVPGNVLQKDAKDTTVRIGSSIPEGYEQLPENWWKFARLKPKSKPKEKQNDREHKGQSREDVFPNED